MILVTGGSGFVGRALVSELIREGRKVRLLTRRPNGFEATSDLQVATGNLLDPSSVRAAIAGVEAVVHLAAVHDAGLLPSVVRSINVGGTRNLALAALHQGVNQFIHCSTAGVYADGKVLGARNESTPLAPTTWYQRTKLEAELAVGTALSHSGVSWIVLRPPAIHGSGRTSVARFYNQIQRRPFWIHTPSTVIDSPTYVGDLVRAILLALDRRHITAEAVNVAGPVALTYPELIDFVARRLGVRVRQFQMRWRLITTCAGVSVAALRAVGRTAPPVLERLTQPIINRSLDITKAERLLGFTPYPLEVGIDETIAWARRERLL